VGSGQQNFDKRQKDFVSHNQKQLMNAVDYRYYVLIYEKSETWMDAVQVFDSWGGMLSQWIIKIFLEIYSAN
jgi:hypothetical protein